MYDEILKALLDDLENGLHHDIYQVILEHGPIKRPELVTKLNENGRNVTDRRARMAINLLRKDGVLILSSSKKGGYYIPTEKVKESVYEFTRELRGRAIDLFRVCQGLENQADLIERAVAQAQGQELQPELPLEESQ